jgi:hypothetical protein
MKTWTLFPKKSSILYYWLLAKVMSDDGMPDAVHSLNYDQNHGGKYMEGIGVEERIILKWFLNSVVRSVLDLVGSQ